MPPTPDSAPLRSAAEQVAERVAELNAAIRALFPHRDARLSDEQRAEYRELLAELERVKRGDVTTAA
jgi:Mor family transcriptional regulator